jgi:hypothetical protein
MSLFLGPLDDTVGKTILQGTTWVIALEFDVDIDGLGRHPLQLDNRGLSDRINDALMKRRSISGVQGKTTAYWNWNWCWRQDSK